MLEYLAENKLKRPSGIHHTLRLQDQVRNPKLWPTPTGHDWKGSGPTVKRKDGKMRGDRLDYAVEQFYPTPRGQDSYERSNWKTIVDANEGGKSQMTLTRKIKYNPDWVEWLMGWPIGWTDLKPLETDKFQQWLKSHGSG
jgi:hypothetical protein